MTTFKEFLLEESDQSIIDLIKNNCKSFLSVWENDPLYRGIAFVGVTKNREKIKLESDTDEASLYWSEFETYTNRSPRNTWQPAHDAADEWFKKNFGWKARSAGVFCSGSYSRASGYGPVSLIFPKGDFKFVWSPKIKDLYHKMPEPYTDITTSVQQYVNMVLDDGDYTGKNYTRAIASFNEIMVSCESYYAIQIAPHFEQDFIKALQ